MKIGRLAVLSGEDKDCTFLLKNLSVFEAGRSPGNHILLKDGSIALSHFRICRNADTYSVYDLGSKGGTLVNGNAIEKIDLAEGDLIHAGNLEIRFDYVDENANGKIASSAPKFEEYTKQAEAPGEEVVSHGTTACLRVIEGEEKGKAFRLIGKKKFTIGRSTKNDIRLRDGKVSRVHCFVERVGNHFIVSDNESANGTVVNGEPVKKTVLKEGDYVRLGFSILRFGWS
jgi:pSer/pThr/pTyr-binding forkhead associated (FHA) protein